MGYLLPRSGGTARKTVTFTGASGLGLDNVNVVLFTVTGRVLISAIAAHCTTNLTESGATANMTMGTVTNPSRFYSTITAGVTALDAGEWWVSAGAPVAGSIDLISASAGATDQVGILASENIVILPSGGVNINGGVLDIYCIWEPLSAGATLVAA
jgi:hypothetical protein